MAPAPCEASTMATGTVERIAYSPKGQVSFRQLSGFRCLLDGDRRSVEWFTPDGKQRQFFFLSAALQQGAITSPAVIVDGDSVREAGSNATTIIAAKGFMPRGAETEVQMLALSFLNAEQVAQVNSCGFLPPWGNYLEADVQSCRLSAAFRGQPPKLIDKAAVEWDADRWEAYMRRRNPPAVAMSKLSPLRDGDTIGRYVVIKWVEVNPAGQKFIGVTCHGSPGG
jgi:hypothetical protein